LLEFFNLHPLRAVSIMKNGQCIKCQSKRIVQIKGRAVWKDWRSYVKATSFICKECGYVEEWVVTEKERDELPKEDSLFDSVS